LGEDDFSRVDVKQNTPDVRVWIQRGTRRPGGVKDRVVRGVDTRLKRKSEG
jgi:hypothetical protein